MAAEKQTLTEVMAEILRQAGVTEATPSFGTTAQQKEIHELTAGQFSIFVQARQDSGDPLSKSTHGCIVAGEIFISVFTKGKNGARKVINRVKDIIKLGYTVDGSFGAPAHPVKIGGSEFLRFWPLGQTFDESAENEGNLWLKEQVIEFQLLDKIGI